MSCHARASFEDKNMNRHHALITFGLIAVASATSAGAASPEEQKKACRGDALHFCSVHIPHRDKIAACLKQHMSELKPACQAMFNEGKSQKSGDQPANSESKPSAEAVQ
jgi:hypothetical protein